MAIELDCPGCRKPLRYADSAAGKRARCSACGSIVKLPLEPGSTVPAAPAAAGESGTTAPADAAPAGRALPSRPLPAERRRALRHGGTDPLRPRRRASGRRSPWLWLVYAACGLLGIFIIGGVLYHGFRRKTPPPGPLVATAPPASEKLPTDEECLAWVEKLEGIIERQDRAAFDAELDLDAMVERALSGFTLPPQDRRGFKDGFKRGMSQSGSLSDVFLQAVTQGGSYDFLRLRRRDNRPAALFRMLNSDGTLNYHEFILAREPNGRVRAVDVYAYCAGERFSETFHRLAAEALPQNLWAQMSGRESELGRSLPQFQVMARHLQAGRNREALETYRKLPPVLRQEKMVLLARLRATARLSQETNSDQEYLAVIDAFRQAFPGDPALDLIEIDGFFLRKQFDRALEAVERLDQVLGGDPYLNLLRANCHVGQGRLEAARQAARRALAETPDTLLVYMTLISISLKAHSFAETAALLSEIRQKFALEFTDLTQAPEYAEFVKSPEYQEWLGAPPAESPEPE